MSGHMISIHYIAYFIIHFFFINVVSYIGQLYLTEFNMMMCQIPSPVPRGLVNVTNMLAVIKRTINPP